MTHQEFSWWLGGALAVTPSDCSDAVKGKTLEVIRKQLVEVLVRDKQQIGIPAPPIANLAYPMGARSL